MDTSLNTVNAGVYNVVISGTRVTASPVNYVLQDVQGSTRVVMSGASVVARHDFLPFGEEIAAGVGMRTAGQGLGVSDNICPIQRVAMLLLLPLQSVFQRPVRVALPATQNPG